MTTRDRTVTELARRSTVEVLRALRTPASARVSFSVSKGIGDDRSSLRRRVRVMAAPSPAPSTPEARVALKFPTGHGLLDGAWWPRSRNLITQLPALVGVLDPLWGRITRVAVNPTLWPPIPREVPVDGRVLKVGWLTPGLDLHQLLLLARGTSRFDLLVIPPETSAPSAARLMTGACTRDGPPPTATALVAAETARLRDRVARDRRQSPEESCQYEGGAISTHSAPLIAER